ncbi:MAG: apolipoprotein A1/A4/E family protein [Dehalococcoidia bacterium]|nr:apolipoprotein A1/A4/E family protein [Dehalococcoidia bacterium]
MNILGVEIGLGQLLVILVVGLLVVGPDKLPYYARKVAKVVRNIRKITNDLTGQVSKALDLDDEDGNAFGIRNDLTAVKESLEKDMADLKASLNFQANDIAETLEKSSREVSETLKKDLGDISESLNTSATEMKTTLEAQAQTVSEAVSTGAKAASDAINEAGGATLEAPKEAPVSIPITPSFDTAAAQTEDEIY